MALQVDVQDFPGPGNFPIKIPGLSGMHGKLGTLYMSLHHISCCYPPVLHVSLQAWNWLIPDIPLLTLSPDRTTFMLISLNISSLLLLAKLWQLKLVLWAKYKTHQQTPTNFGPRSATQPFQYTGSRSWWHGTVVNVGLGRRTFPVARSTFSWWVTTYMGYPLASQLGQLRLSSSQGR